MDIVVLAGGLSTERDVSFKTGSMIDSDTQGKWTPCHFAGCVYGI